MVNRGPMTPMCSYSVCPTGRSFTKGMSKCCNCCAGPTPESISSLADSNAPADSMTSLRALTNTSWGLPNCFTTTPFTRLYSCPSVFWRENDLCNMQQKTRLKDHKIKGNGALPSCITNFFTVLWVAICRFFLCCTGWRKARAAVILLPFLVDCCRNDTPI